jgi:hypothetical protein
MINETEVFENYEEDMSFDSRACKSSQSINGSCSCGKTNCSCCEQSCEPCQIESKTSFPNPCGPTCCTPIIPQNFSVSCAVPYAIETKRVFDTMKFQVFTDGICSPGTPVQFVTEVIGVNGSIPAGAPVEVRVEQVSINYESLTINPGSISLGDYTVEESGSSESESCKVNYEYLVCGEKDSKCCGQGKSSPYKQRGLSVTVAGLVLELQGKCGCTEFSAIVYPVCNSTTGSQTQCAPVQFVYNTLSAPICTPANGSSFELRQSYQTSLTVDCIGKSLLSYTCYDGKPYYELVIPNGIDIICCLQEIVSILKDEQLVVLGGANVIQPRVVDTFAKVCEFNECPNTMNNNMNN